MEYQHDGRAVQHPRDSLCVQKEEKATLRLQGDGGVTDPRCRQNLQDRRVFNGL